MSYDVFVVGSINTDLIVSVERRPNPGETLAGSDLATVPGGKGGNQASAIGRLGGRVALLARIGADERGAALRTALRANGVDDRYLLETSGAATGSAIITITPDGENTIVVSRGANARVTIDDVDAAARDLDAASVVLAQLELPPDVVAHALSFAARGGKRAILNAAPATDVPRDLLALLDPLVVNEHEASIMLGEQVAAENAGDAARGLVGRGARSAVITLGAAGATSVDATGRAHHVDAEKIRVVDTTGAGDAFTGALALELARGGDLAAAVAVAVRAGTFAAKKYGAQASLPTRVEIGLT